MLVDIRNIQCSTTCWLYDAPSRLRSPNMSSFHLMTPKDIETFKNIHNHMHTTGPHLAHRPPPEEKLLDSAPLRAISAMGGSNRMTIAFNQLSTAHVVQIILDDIIIARTYLGLPPPQELNIVAQDVNDVVTTTSTASALLPPARMLDLSRFIGTKCMSISSTMVDPTTIPCTVNTLVLGSHIPLNAEWQFSQAFLFSSSLVPSCPRVIRLHFLFDIDFRRTVQWELLSVILRWSTSTIRRLEVMLPGVMAIDEEFIKLCLRARAMGWRTDVSSYSTDMTKMCERVTFVAPASDAESSIDGFS